MPSIKFAGKTILCEKGENLPFSSDATEAVPEERFVQRDQYRDALQGVGHLWNLCRSGRGTAQSHDKDRKSGGSRFRHTDLVPVFDLLVRHQFWGILS